MLLAADDYSAVSGRVPLSNLYERGRSLGIGVQVSAQSWQGLGATEDERYRIAATADGGIFVLHTPYPEPLVALAGTRRVLETAHKLIGGAGAMRAPPASSTPGPPTPTWSAAWRSARPATSSAARPPSSTSPGPGPPRSPCSRRPPSHRPRRRYPDPGRSGTPPPIRGRRPGGLDDFFDPGDPR